MNHDPLTCEAGVCRAERADLAARIDADNARIRTELAARLDRLDDTHIDAALHWLAHEVPDAVNDALNEIGAPE